MAIVSLLAVGRGSDSFVAGLLLGAALGLLLGPGFRSWLIRRELSDAARQDRLAGEALAQMEREFELADAAEPEYGPAASSFSPGREPGGRSPAG